MTLDKFVKGTLAAGLLVSSSVSATEWISRSDLDSQCMLRADRISANASEDRVMSPLGLENCATLETYVDPDLEDPNPVPITLDAGQTYDFATVRTQNLEAPADSYTVSGLPAWASFDSQFGVTTLTPPPGTQGEFLVEYNVVPTQGASGSVNPLFVLYDIGASFTIDGLDFENNGSVSSTPYHGTWADANNDGVIDQPVVVREGRSPSSPWEAYVLASDGKSVTLDPQSALPDYVTMSGNRIDFRPGTGAEGESGSLEFLVCDEVDTSDCTSLSVPYEVVDTKPVIVGLSYSGENGTIDNPNDQGAFYDINTVDCQLSEFDERWVVATPYDFEYTYDISDPAPNMGISGGTGRIDFNPTCGQAGQTYFPQVKVTGSGGESTWVSSVYQVE